MVSPEYGNKEFQSILSRGLNLSTKASFQSRDKLRGLSYMNTVSASSRTMKKPLSWFAVSLFPPGYIS